MSATSNCIIGGNQDKLVDISNSSKTARLGNYVLEDLMLATLCVVHRCAYVAAMHGAISFYGVYIMS